MFSYYMLPGNKPETDVIVSWVERRNRAPVTTIQDVHALNRFKSEHKVKHKIIK